VLFNEAKFDIKVVFNFRFSTNISERQLTSAQHSINSSVDMIVVDAIWCTKLCLPGVITCISNVSINGHDHHHIPGHARRCNINSDRQQLPTLNNNAGIYQTWRRFQQWSWLRISWTILRAAFDRFQDHTSLDQVQETISYSTWEDVVFWST
jgi:hypothetical protein